MNDDDAGETSNISQPAKVHHRERKILVCGTKDSANLSDFLTFIGHSNGRSSTGSNLSPISSKYSGGLRSQKEIGSFGTPSHPPSSNLPSLEHVVPNAPCNNGSSDRTSQATSTNLLTTNISAADEYYTHQDTSSGQEIMLNWDGSNVPAGVISRQGGSTNTTGRQRASGQSFDQSLWFNYGFTEETFKSWIHWQLTMRHEKLQAWATSNRKT